MGTQLELKDKSGHPAHARVDALTEQNVRLNMNHPLAGKQLDFEITIAGLRPATDEEVSHGHVHTHDHG
jgi:FKBP-type peptidyl-prolyl cis-trans isomerase SlyD